MEFMLCNIRLRSECQYICSCGNFLLYSQTALLHGPTRVLCYHTNSCNHSSTATQKQAFYPPTNQRANWGRRLAWKRKFTSLYLFRHSCIRCIAGFSNIHLKLQLRAYVNKFLSWLKTST